MFKHFGGWRELLAPDDGSGGGTAADAGAGGEAAKAEDQGGGEGAAEKLAAAAKAAAQDGAAKDGGDGTGDGKDGDGGKDGGPGAGEPKVPEAYALTVPEGSALKVEALAAEAKALKLTQAEAEALVKVRAADAQRDAALRAENLEAVKKDPALGGAQLEKTATFVQRGFEQLVKSARLNDAEAAYVRDFFKGPDGNHPAFVRLFRWVGVAVTEDTPPGGKGQGTTTPKTPAEVLYGAH